MHQCIKFIYFRKTLYMFRTAVPSIISSSRLYIQQQTDTAVCLLANRQQYLFGICLLQYVQFELLMMDGKTVRNMYSVFLK